MRHKILSTVVLAMVIFSLASMQAACCHRDPNGQCKDSTDNPLKNTQDSSLIRALLVAGDENFRVDIDMIETYLRQVFPCADIRRLFISHRESGLPMPTKENIISNLKWLAEQRSSMHGVSTKNAISLLYFSGHGAIERQHPDLKLIDGHIKVYRENSDGNSGSFNDLITAKQLIDQPLAQMKEHSIKYIILLDSCNSGFFIEHARRSLMGSVKIADRFAILSSSHLDTASLSGLNGQRVSYFTKSLVNSLDRLKHDVTLEELAMSVRAMMNAGNAQDQIPEHYPAKTDLPETSGKSLFSLTSWSPREHPYAAVGRIISKIGSRYTVQLNLSEACIHLHKESLLIRSGSRFSNRKFVVEAVSLPDSYLPSASESASFISQTCIVTLKEKSGSTQVTELERLAAGDLLIKEAHLQPVPEPIRIAIQDKACEKFLNAPQILWNREKNPKSADYALTLDKNTGKCSFQARAYKSRFLESSFPFTNESAKIAENIATIYQAHLWETIEIERRQFFGSERERGMADPGFHYTLSLSPVDPNERSAEIADNGTYELRENLDYRVHLKLDQCPFTRSCIPSRHVFLCAISSDGAIEPLYVTRDNLLPQNSGIGPSERCNSLNSGANQINPCHVTLNLPNGKEVIVRLKPRERRMIVMQAWAEAPPESNHKACAVALPYQWQRVNIPDVPPLGIRPPPRRPQPVIVQRLFIQAR